MGKINSRAKGATFERQIARILKERGFEARRGVQFNGMYDADVESSSFPFHIECKKVQALNLFDAYAQSTRDCEAQGKKEVPMVIHAKNRTKIMATMELHDFLSLVQLAMGNKDNLNEMCLDKYIELLKEEEPSWMSL